MMMMWTYHEVTLHKRHFMRVPFPLGMGSSAFGLIGVIVQSDHVAASEGSDFLRWFPNTTSHIKDRHLIFDSDFARE